LRETPVGGEIGRKIIASEATTGVAGAIIGAGGGAGFVGFIRITGFGVWGRVVGFVVTAGVTVIAASASSSATSLGLPPRSMILLRCLDSWSDIILGEFHLAFPH